MPTARLFVGNLPYTMTDNKELAEIFAGFGVTVDRPHIVIDRETGMGKGFGFVELDAAAVETTMEAMNGARVGGRPIRIDRAVERERPAGGPRPSNRPSGGGGGSGGGGFSAHGHDKRGHRDRRDRGDRDW